MTMTSHLQISSRTTQLRSLTRLLNDVFQRHADSVLLDLVREGEQLTYREVGDAAAQLGAAVLAVGGGATQHVGLFLPSGRDYVSSWFGCLLAGHVDVSVNHELRGELLAYAIDKADVDVLVCTAEDVDAVAAAREHLAEDVTVLVLGGTGPGTSLERAGLRIVLWADVAEDPGTARGRLPDDVDDLALASIRFTSGSSGRPKGVMMCQRHMLVSALAFCELTGLREGGVMYTCFPFHHVLATVTGVLAAAAVGGTAAIAPKFSASRYWQEIARSGATVAQALDPLMPILMKQPPRASDREHTATVLYTAAGSYPEFRARFGVDIRSLFDMSELSVLTHQGPGVEVREGSCGQNSGLFDIALVDESDLPVATGEEGQIVARPRVPGVMALGYYNDGARTAEAFRNLWFHTGDRARVDEDGYYYFTGRAGDRIRHRGVNVAPDDLEETARALEGVGEVAAIGVPGELGEDDIKLCFSVTEGATVSEADIIAHVSSRVPAYMAPRYAERLDNLPRTDTHKIQKGRLRAAGDRGITRATWDAERGDYSATPPRSLLGPRGSAARTGDT